MQNNMRSFGSDNHSGVHPAILEAISRANSNHCIAYGEDAWTEQAVTRYKEIFGHDIHVFFVFNGTAANVLSINTMLKPFHSVISASTSHIHKDECGALEKITGNKMQLIPTPHGKLSVELLEKHIHFDDAEHHVQPKMISLSQPTEVGTVYTIEELKQITDFAHEHNMYVHMDGARLSNAAVALKADFRSFTRDAGIDILSFGGTKNGMLLGESIVVFNHPDSDSIKYYRKQNMQLGSKMRYFSAQFIEFLSNDLWKHNAEHANKMAAILTEKISHLTEIKPVHPVETNGIFAYVHPEIVKELQKEFFFYVWDEEKSVIRWMTSFDTSEEDIEKFASRIEEVYTEFYK